MANRAWEEPSCCCCCQPWPCQHPLPWKRGCIFAYKCSPVILSTPKVGSALGVIAWCIMEEIVHLRICPSASNKRAKSTSAPLHHSFHLEQGQSGTWRLLSFPSVGIMESRILPSTTAETMSDSSTSCSQGQTSASLQHFLALALLRPQIILH